eukprot:2249071-Pyramimonas_sp.AAC.1
MYQGLLEDESDAEDESNSRNVESQLGSFSNRWRQKLATMETEMRSAPKENFDPTAWPAKKPTGRPNPNISGATCSRMTSEAAARRMTEVVSEAHAQLDEDF